MRGPVGWALARSVSVEDLLVVGTTVSRPADDHVLGSRSVQIASISRGTVAVVPPLLGDHRSGVVVGIETVADLPALLVLGLRESHLVGEPLVLIHCSSRGGRNSASVLSAIDEALTAVDDDVRVIHLRCDPAEGLVGTAAHASLLVLGRSRTPDLNPLGTTCHRVLSRARSPVLIAPVHIGPTHIDPTAAGARSDHPEEARP